MSKEQAVRPSPLWFVFLSSVYVLGTLVAIVRNWEHMAEMAPNEWGDVAAGVFSPLAFLWFLYTALAQRAELRLQQDELRQNTKAQQDQEQQMMRQANALDAQAARLQGQADAQYQPILFLSTSGQGTPGHFLLYLRNHGATILDVSCPTGRPTHVQNNSGTPVISPRGNIAPILKQDHELVLELRIGDLVAFTDHNFELHFTRLDAQRVIQRYTYNHAEQRLVLGGRDFVNEAVAQ
jgi:hypothetical protein